MTTHAASPALLGTAKPAELTDELTGGVAIALLALLIVMLAGLAKPVTPEKIMVNVGGDEIPMFAIG